MENIENQSIMTKAEILFRVEKALEYFNLHNIKMDQRWFISLVGDKWFDGFAIMADFNTSCDDDRSMIWFGMEMTSMFHKRESIYHSENDMNEVIQRLKNAGLNAMLIRRSYKSIEIVVADHRVCDDNFSKMTNSFQHGLIRCVRAKKVSTEFTNFIK